MASLVQLLRNEPHEVVRTALDSIGQIGIGAYAALPEIERLLSSSIDSVPTSWVTPQRRQWTGLGQIRMNAVMTLLRIGSEGTGAAEWSWVWCAGTARLSRYRCGTRRWGFRVDISAKSKIRPQQGILRLSIYTDTDGTTRCGVGYEHFEVAARHFDEINHVISKKRIPSFRRSDDWLAPIASFAATEKSLVSGKQQVVISRSRGSDTESQT